jgi:SAM-dependent methyltransferase
MSVDHEVVEAKTRLHTAAAETVGEDGPLASPRVGAVAPARPRVRPVRAVVGALLRAAPQLTPRVEKLLWRAFYEAASLGRRDPGTALMNYGYASARPSTSEIDPSDDQFGRQMYLAVAGAADLAARDVLEVSCGRGGGAAFVFERLAPRSMTGLDLASRAIARCRERYERPGLRFVVGDAERLPFADESFDAVLSVEATHCYSDTARFLAEACRVLRPGGLMLLADFRHTILPAGAETALVPQEDVRILHEQLAVAGFDTLEECDITDNVIRALALDTPRRRARIQRRLPRPLRRAALGFAAIEGSPMYEAFVQRRWTYLRFVLRKH